MYFCLYKFAWFPQYELQYGLSSNVGKKVHPYFFGFTIIAYLYLSGITVTPRVWPTPPVNATQVGTVPLRLKWPNPRWLPKEVSVRPVHTVQWEVEPLYHVTQDNSVQMLVRSNQLQRMSAYHTSCKYYRGCSSLISLFLARTTIFECQYLCRQSSVTFINYNMSYRCISAQ